MILVVLILFIVLNCVFKLSMWCMWQRFIFSVMLGVFTYTCVGIASQQSKTQLALWMQDTAVLQNIAVLITVESIACCVFCFLYLVMQRDEMFESYRRRRLREISYAVLHWYPSLLMFPVVFYLLAQLMFVAIGMTFRSMGLLPALGIAVLLPLLSEGVRWLLPDEEGRVEMHLLLSLFVCIFGWLTTQTSQMVYLAPDSPVSWQNILLTVAGFIIFFSTGLLRQQTKARRTR